MCIEPGFPMQLAGRSGDGEVRWGSRQTPALIMYECVVEAAEQDQVVQIGWTPVEPMPDVMGVAPSRRPVACRESATSVPILDEVALPAAHHSFGASELDRHGFGAEYVPSELGVAGHPTHFLEG